MSILKKIADFIRIVFLLIATILFLVFYKKTHISYPVSIVLFIIIIGLFRKMTRSGRFDKKLDAIDGFSPTKKMVGHWGFIALDHKRKLIAIKELHAKSLIYPYEDIMDCEIIIDKQKVLTRSGSDVYNRAIIGDILHGDTGAIIGGITAEQREDTSIKTLDFKILFKNFNKPYALFHLYDAIDESHKERISQNDDSIHYGVYKERLEEAHNFKHLIDIVISENKAS